MTLTNLLRLCLVVSAGLAAAALQPGMAAQSPTAPPGIRATAVSIEGDHFLINGRPTLAGLKWHGHTLEGLLLNSRMVQGIFDDLNPETRGRWAYPDTKPWDPDRNTREFVAAMPEWRRHGLLAFTINLQGGSPEGYSQDQPWHNSAFDGRRRAAAGVHGPTRAHPRRGRRAGHGRHPRPLLLRPGRAAARRSRRASRGRRDGGMGARPGLPQRADRDQQRVQRPLRPRDPAAGARPRTDHAGEARSREAAAGCWSARATAAARCPAPRCWRPRTSCCCTATA